MKNEWLLGRSFDTLPSVKIIGTSLKVFWLLQGESSRTGDVESQLMVREFFLSINHQLTTQTKDLLTEKKIWVVLTSKTMI